MRLVTEPLTKGSVSVSRRTKSLSRTNAGAVTRDASAVPPMPNANTFPLLLLSRYSSINELSER